MASLRQLTTRLPLPSQLQIRRTMASAASPKREFQFLVILPDKPGALQRRLDARGAHFERIKPQVQAGNCIIGGALLNDVPKDDDVSSLDFWGSTVVMKAKSKDEVIERLKKDPYTQADVWDWDKVQIYPFKLAWEVKGTM